MTRRAEYKRELQSYLAGFGLAVALTSVAFGCVAWPGMPRTTSLWIIATTAVIQIVVHLRYFLHIDLCKSKRDDLELMVFTVLVVALMAGGTIWILGNLRDRMM
jgi:cytochrome o ubiquinol oxidase operon protein cyoD